MAQPEQGHWMTQELSKVFKELMQVVTKLIQVPRVERDAKSPTGPGSMGQAKINLRKEYIQEFTIKMEQFDALCDEIYALIEYSKCQYLSQKGDTLSTTLKDQEDKALQIQQALHDFTQMKEVLFSGALQE